MWCRGVAISRLRSSTTSRGREKLREEREHTCTTASCKRNTNRSSIGKHAVYFTSSGHHLHMEPSLHVQVQGPAWHTVQVMRGVGPRELAYHKRSLTCHSPGSQKARQLVASLCFYFSYTPLTLSSLHMYMCTVRNVAHSTWSVPMQIIPVCLT